MKKATIKLFLTDLIQAKILTKDEQVSFIKLIRLLVRYRTARIHLSIRFRSSKNFFLKNLSKLYLDSFFIEIGNLTVIGEYFWLPHPRCIIIADHVIIGQHVHVGQYVTIGGNFKKVKHMQDGSVQKLPILGDRINIHPGAVIGGPVTIGNDVIVGANSVVTHDVPHNTIVFGQNQFANKKIRLPDKGGEFYTI